NIIEALNVAEGSFLQQFNNSAEPPYTYFISFIEKDPIYGPNVLVGILLLPNATGVWTNFPHGNGTLATITFKAIYRLVQPNTVTCRLDLADTMIIDENLQEVPHLTVGAVYEMEPLPIPSLNVEPATYTASLAGEVFTVNVTIKNLDADWRLIGVQFRIQYDEDVLKALSVVEGPFLQQFNNSAEPPYTYFISFIEKDPIYGPNVLVGILLLPNATGVWTNFPHGNGTLATITFKAIKQTSEPQAPITAMLRLNNTMLINDTLIEIPHTTLSGYYEIKPLSFTYEPAIPFAGRLILFKAPEAKNSATYCWDFGDGTKINTTESTIGHIYTSQGEYNVTLYCIADNIVTPSVSKTITVWPAQPTIDVNVDVGTLHFRGEIAEFSILISSNGEDVNATKIKAFLYHDGMLYADLTNSIQQVSIGFYIIRYNIPGDAETGTYTLFLKAECYNAKGVSIKSFQISPTLTARITEISNGIATVSNGLTNIMLNLTSVNATISNLVKTSSGEILAEIRTATGTLTTKLDTINATITGLIIGEGGVFAKIDTALGTLTAKLDNINATIVKIDGNTATLLTDIGEVKTALGGIQSTATPTLYATSILSAIAVILAAAILIFIRKK
ncbi:MAG: PKD domain-containing protein, partial [Candidatus Bathyarchaeia archaeon]